MHKQKLAEKVVSKMLKDDAFRLGNMIGVYNVTVTNQDDLGVVKFRGTVFRTKEQYIISD